MSRYLIVGGFEPSGHDSTAEAIIEAGRAIGKHVDFLLWRDRVDLADHPMFTSHRIAAGLGSYNVAGLLDEDWIGDVLSKDLASYVDTDYDAYICVHPWSTLIVANALILGNNTDSQLVDYHSDFGAFPVITHERVDAYLGGGSIRALEPAIRTRCHVVGVAVPDRFIEDNDQGGCGFRKQNLVVSAGSDGWAIESIAPAVEALTEILRPATTILLAPNESAKHNWEARIESGAKILTGLTDIAPLLRQSRWYLSKGGGTAVAEGLAAGCVNFVSYSGIFWEDEAAQSLYSKGIAQLIDVNAPHSIGDNVQKMAKIERKRTINAPYHLWELIEKRLPKNMDPREESTLENLISRVMSYKNDVLPETSSKLTERLLAWRNGWKP